MENAIRYFKRLERGQWECVKKGEFNGPNGRIQVSVGSRFIRGTNFMGVDIAQLLDDQYDEGR